MRRSRSRLAVAAVSVTVLGLTGSAIAAGIEVPQTAAGQGSEEVTGFEVINESLEYASNLHEQEHGDVRVEQVQLQIEAVDSAGNRDTGYARPTRIFVAVLADEGGYTARYRQCTQESQAEGITTFSDGVSAVTVCELAEGVGNRPLLSAVDEIDVVAYEDVAELP